MRLLVLQYLILNRVALITVESRAGAELVRTSSYDHQARAVGPGVPRGTHVEQTA
jgi:hypothetical protein